MKSKPFSHKKRAVFRRLLFMVNWQPRKDLNLNKMNQNHLCYRYTTGLYR